MPDMNKGAKMGFTDKDYIEALGLDPALEGKPEINKAIEQTVFDQVVTAYVHQGLTPEQAKKIAMREMK